jgi:hypothetical protein
MFGLNDNNTQTNDNTSANPQDTPEPMPANPFNDGSPSMPPAPTAAPSEPPISPSSSYTAPSLPPEPPAPGSTSSMNTSASASTPSNSGLMDIKQQALQSLQPLVSHLDQSPEEKFKTTMMMIQATDDPELVKQAYEIADKIPDEKARAQALLDVVNEINYFTHKEDKK